jgi:ribA/ribD-fused uncharacterized protein
MSESVEEVESGNIDIVNEGESGVNESGVNESGVNESGVNESGVNESGEVESGEILVNEPEETPLIKELTPSEEDKYRRTLKTFYSERLEHFGSKKKLKSALAKMQKGEDVSDLLASAGVFKQETVIKKGVRTKKLTIRPEPASYLPSGDLSIQIKGLETTIAVPSYRPPTAAELLTMQEEYDKALANQCEAFEIAREELRKAIADGKRIKKAQLKVQQEDLKLQTIRFAERGIRLIPSVEIRHILFDEPQNDHMMDIGAFNASRLAIQKLYALNDNTAPVISEEAAREVEEAKEAEEPGAQPIIAFSIPENEYGELSSWAPATFKIFGISYNSAYQAYMAMLADELEKDDEAEAIRALDSAEEIMKYETIKEDVADEVLHPALERITLDVNRAKFEQNPELAQILLSTGDALLVFVPPEKPDDMFLGVGLALDSRRIKKPKKWPGQRIFGKALELVRKELQTKSTVKKAIAKPTATSSILPKVSSKAIPVVSSQPLPTKSTVGSTIKSILASARSSIFKSSKPVITSVIPETAPPSIQPIITTTAKTAAIKSKTAKPSII